LAKKRSRGEWELDFLKKIKGVPFLLILVAMLMGYCFSRIKEFFVPEIQNSYPRDRKEKKEGG